MVHIIPGRMLWAGYPEQNLGVSLLLPNSALRRKSRMQLHGENFAFVVKEAHAGSADIGYFLFEFRVSGLLSAATENLQGLHSCKWNGNQQPLFRSGKKHVGTSFLNGY